MLGVLQMPSFLSKGLRLSKKRDHRKVPQAKSIAILPIMLLFFVHAWGSLLKVLDVV